MGVKIRKHWQLYLFLALPVIYMLVFCYYPMFGVQIAFKDFVASDGIWGSKWVGLKHFRQFFSSPNFWEIFGNTVKLSLYGLLVGFPLNIILALCLNSLRSLKYKKFVQTVTYIPHFISTVVLVGIMMQCLNPVSGLYGFFYRFFGGDGYPADVLGKASAFRHLYVWSDIWQNLGWGTIVYVAALAGVDPQQHEAAMIDGASRFKRVLYIDLPEILPVASVLLILSAGGIMGVGFEKVYLMQNNLNLSMSEVISTYIYKVGLAQGGSSFSYGAAVGLFNSAISCGLLILVNYISSKLNGGESALW